MDRHPTKVAPTVLRADGPAWGRVCAVGVAIWAAGSWEAKAENVADDWQADRQRVVKTFDFDEPDNLGTIPKYWELFPGESFPHYAGGRFDHNLGQTAPPSFYLDMNGRNVAFRYRGMETRIRPESDYLVVGWIRPDRLRTGRATISAYYLDHQGLPLPQTQRHGRLVGGEQDGEGWQEVEVFLPAGPVEADALGLTLWVEQASIWDPTPRPERHIEPADIRAGAWFDDLLVYRLPRVTLRAAALGNIFIAPQKATLECTILDPDGSGLTAELEVRDAAGALVDRREVPAHAEGHQVVLPDLGPGYYQAGLGVRSGGHTLVERPLNFGVLGDLRVGSGYTSHAFGVVLTGAERNGSDAEVALIAAAGLGAVKVPLWTGSSTTPGFTEDTHALDVILNELLRLRVDVTGVLGGVPPELVRGGQVYQRSLIDILNDPVESWRGFVSAAVAPYASVLATWQVGADGDPSAAEDPRLARSLGAVRQEMLRLMTSPYLTAPCSLDADPQGRKLIADRISLNVPSGIHPEYLGAHLQAFRNLGYMRVEAYMAPPPAAAYARMARLAHWATQVIEARHAGVDTVYVPQLWHWRRTARGPTVEPTEEFVIYRTIARVLGEARPDGLLPADEGIRALLFTQGTRAVLVAWDSHAPSPGRTWEVQLGDAHQVLDLWGRARPLERTADGLHRLVLTPSPVFVPGIERWVTALQRDLRLLPESVTFGLGAREHQLHLVNRSNDLLSGVLTLDVPDSWRAQPRHLEFSLPADGESDVPMELRYCPNEAAGTKTVYAHVRLEGAGGHPLRVPLRFELGIEDVDVWGFATVQGETVVVRHGVRNRSTAALSFRASAAAPSRDRQYKVIIGLEPGQSAERQYRFERAEDLIGRTIRISLREVNGPRLHHLEVPVQ